MSDAKHVKRLLRERVAELAPYLFPNGKRDGVHWCVGSIEGEPGRSFKICISGEKAGLWGDFADSGKHSRSLLDLWMHARNVDFKTAFREAAAWTGCPLHGLNGTGSTRARVEKPGQEWLNWRACREAFTEKHVERLARWRGYSIEFCSWLKQSGFVGLHNGFIAFPVHDRAGNVVAVHYRLKDGSWRYSPLGGNVRPLAIGELIAGEPVHVFESPWDGLDYLDKSGERDGVIITRGASNGAFVAGLIPENSPVYLWTQNDAAGEKWERDICTNTKAAVKRVKIPAQHKDLNDWTRVGATGDDLFAAITSAEVITPPRVDLAAMLDSICDFLQRYVRFSSRAQPIAVALWIVHTWVLDAFDYTPYLHVHSPEKRCGKTKLLDCIALIVKIAWRAISPTEPVLFRKIERDKPTLLLDEVDSVFSGGKDERKEPLRAILNAGFERKAKVPRCVGQNLEVRDFDVFCAKAFAGIGRLPDTVSDRCISTSLVRRSRDESVERFRKREVEIIVRPIRALLAEWADKNETIEKLRSARPDVPGELSDRQADICEPLLAIADLAGCDWPQRSRKALVNLCVGESDEDESTGVKLLSGIREAFDAKGEDRIATRELLEQLVNEDTDAPWASWWEHDLKIDNVKGPGARLAKLLKPYHIKPRPMRLSDGTTRGYVRDDFLDAWQRYCPPETAKNM